jgi:hypothetical protein
LVSWIVVVEYHRGLIGWCPGVSIPVVVVVEAFHNSHARKVVVALVPQDYGMHQKNICLFPWRRKQEQKKFQTLGILQRMQQDKERGDQVGEEEEESTAAKLCDTSMNNEYSSTSLFSFVMRRNLFQKMMGVVSTSSSVISFLFLETRLEQKALAYEEEYSKMDVNTLERRIGQDEKQQQQQQRQQQQDVFLSKDSTRNIFEINDPNTYSGLVYIPPADEMRSHDTHDTSSVKRRKKFPVLFVLHGAGKNELDTWNLANIQGEHGGLAPSLLASNQAPKELYENFVVIAPYSRGKASFYDEPRSKLLQFMNFSLSRDGGGAQGGIDLDVVDVDCKFLFGFSDGATLGVELLTTKKFVAGVFCAYGFTGKLPSLALERLKGIPMWIFHSADDGKCEE